MILNVTKVYVFTVKLPLSSCLPKMYKICLSTINVCHDS